MQLGAANELPGDSSVLWEVFARYRSSNTLRREGKKLVRQLAALDERAFQALVAEWVLVLDQLRQTELAEFALQGGLCGNDLEFLNLRCAIVLRGREFYEDVWSGQRHLAVQCQPEVTVWVGLSELVIGVLWAASFERAGNFTLFDQLLSDDEYLRLLMTDFFVQDEGGMTADSPDELMARSVTNIVPQDGTAVLSALENALDQGDLARAFTLATPTQHPVLGMEVPGLGRVRQGSVLRDRHGEKCWVYHAGRHGSGGTEIMVLRRSGRVSTVMLNDSGPWRLLST